MLCAEFVMTDAGAVLRPTPVQPADVTGCPVVVMQGSDTALLSVFKTPTPTDFASAWVWGFSLVVGSFVIAWGAGAVVNFVNNRSS